MGGAVVPKNRNFSVWSREASEIKSKEIILLATSFVWVNFNKIDGCKTKRYNDHTMIEGINNGKLINVLWYNFIHVEFTNSVLTTMKNDNTCKTFTNS